MRYKKWVNFFLILVVIFFNSIFITTNVGCSSYNKIEISNYIFSTFLGGLGEDLIHDSIIDSDGNIIIAGVTSSPNFPTENPFQATYAGGGDSFVAKISTDGQKIIFSTFLGGSNMDIVSAISLDKKGNIIVSGETHSSNFPTINAFQDELKGTIDLFLTKFSPNGTALFSTYFGGSGYEIGRCISFDSNNSIILTGHTTSIDFPITSNAHQSSFGGGSDDAFIIQISEDGQLLHYSSYLGGNSIDGGTQIIVDNNDFAIISGTTNSFDFNTTTNAYQNEFKGGINDCFVTYFDLETKQLVYSSFYGGTEKEMPWGMELDSECNLILSGYTNSGDFPVSIDAYQETFGGENDIFVFKLNNFDYSLNFSTLLGGSGEEYSKALISNENSYIFLVGQSNSEDYPITENAFQLNKNNLADVIISIFDPNGQNLIYSTFLGGSNFDCGSGISLDNNHNLIITGSSLSTDFHTENALQGINGGLYDNIICKFNLTYAQTTKNNSINITTLVLIFAGSIILFTIFIRKKRRINL